MHATHTQHPFDQFGLEPVLLRAVYALGYEAPTPIQKEAIPAVLAGRDVIGTAQTGSGKTAAFLLPILQRLLKQPPGRTRALVLSPTRELAAQIEVALRGLAKGTRIRGHAVYGGVGMAAQEHALRAGVDVVVATPGRLLDHMSRRNVDFRGLQVLVLDEADRMLDMGFLPDVRRIVDALPRDRQTLLFSATMLPEIEVLSRTIMRNPARISVSPPHPRRPAGRPGRFRGRPDPRGPEPESAGDRPRRLPERTAPDPDRDRCRGPRHRRRGHLPCDQLRHPDRRHGLRAQGRADGAHGGAGRGDHVRDAGGRRRPARDRAGPRPDDSPGDAPGFRLPSPAASEGPRTRRRANLETAAPRQPETAPPVLTLRSI